ncbi:hypothetical protein V8V75_25810, partial [Peribacillus frigoritolerans]|uniref:hypothetical protein n=1 Tax=Peribacillus frigoritolerans TaxID=450367 RepID=UPI003008EFEA
TTKQTRSILDKALFSLGFIPRTSVTKYVRVAVYDKFKAQVPVIEQSTRYTSLLYSFAGKQLLLAGVHLISMVSESEEYDRLISARDDIKSLEEFENLNKIDNTVLIGDFNMNTFEIGMVSHRGLNSTFCKRTAKLAPISKAKKKYFFNPSWRAFANDSLRNKPPGTIYYDKPKKSAILYWNMLDQVLIRPNLLSSATDKSFEIITRTKTKNLLTNNGIPDAINYSDHLPIKFKLKI